MDYEKREAMIGHILNASSDEYGDMKGLYMELEKLPHVQA